MARMSSAKKYETLRHMSYGSCFVHELTYDALDRLISDGILTCDAQGDWVLTERGQRSLRSMKAIDMKRRRLAKAAKRA